MKSSDPTFRSRFLAYRRATMLGVALASLGTLKAADSMDGKDTARRANSLLAERLPSMDDSTAEVDRIEIKTSRMEIADELAPRHYTESYQPVTKGEKERLALEVDALRWHESRARGMWLAIVG